VIDLDVSSILAILGGGGFIFILLQNKYLKHKVTAAKVRLRNSDTKDVVDKEILRNVDEVAKYDPKIKKEIKDAETFASVFDLFNRILSENASDTDKD